MNDAIFLFLYGFAHQSAMLDQLIVFFAFYFPYLVIIVAGVFILMHHEVLKAEAPEKVFWEKKKEISKAFLAGLFAWLIAQGLKFLLALARPATALGSISPLLQKNDYAFPSGHATFFMALAVSIYFFHKKAGYIFMLAALIIGLARVMAGVHFPADVLGGLVLGALVACLVKNM